MEHDDGETDVASYRVPVMLVDAMKLALVEVVGEWMEATDQDEMDAGTLNAAMLVAVGMAMDIAVMGGAPEGMMQ
jgi:hypothetical protein